MPHAEAAIARGAPEPAIRVRAAAVLSAVGRAEDAASALSGAAATGGWLAPSLRPTAPEVAGALGIAVPEAWR